MYYAFCIIGDPDVSLPLRDGNIPPEAEDITSKFLCTDPLLRLGSLPLGGIEGVKRHAFFDGLDWQNLLRQKAEFVTSLHGAEGLENAIYVDSKRYSVLVIHMIATELGMILQFFAHVLLQHTMTAVMMS